MCDRCINALQKYFPELPEREAIDLLWQNTCFPFGKVESIEQQLMELAKARFITQEIGA